MDAQLVAAARIIQAQPPGMDCFQMPAACDQRYVKSRVRQITADAAAHTAGIMALILEWNVLKGHYTTISGRDINRLLIRGAVRDASMDYPNRTWGYGRLDLMGMFRSLV